MNEYDGYRVLWKQRSKEVERVDVNSLTESQFFDRYVSTRKPVVVRGLSKDLENLQKKWSFEYLKELVGDVSVQAEVRESEADSFGQGKKETIKFGDLLDAIDKGSTRYYMTTQEFSLNDKQQQEVVSSPLKQMIERGTMDFPIVPSLLASLIPSNLNIWVGNSPNGTSTGLHHDYHDNLYILLRGKKRFRLFSPGDAQAMYTRGTIVRVHPNGRINYEGFLTRADGAVMGHVLEWEKELAEKELEAAEEDLRKGVEGAQERFDRAEKALDKLLDGLLHQPEDSEFFDEFAGQDDYVDSDVPEESDDDDGGASQQEAVDASGQRAKRRRVESVESEKDPREYPLNFSTVDDMENPDKSRFPEFLQANPLFAELEEGDMLYLPCGWFHEVTSFSVTSHEDATTKPGHFAFNYWMHPPTQKNISSPYEDSFWKATTPLTSD